MEKMHKATLAEKLGYGLGELPGTMNAIMGAVLTMFQYSFWNFLHVHMASGDTSGHCGLKLQTGLPLR